TSGPTAPNGVLTACIIGQPGCVPSPPLDRTYLSGWTAPNVGTVLTYSGYRVPVAPLTDSCAPSSPTPGGSCLVTPTTPDAATLFLVEGQQLPDGKSLTYWVKANLDDGSK